jgi:retron-type reverse transcriptase
MTLTFADQIYNKSFLLKQIESISQNANRRSEHKKKPSSGLNIQMLFFHRHALAAKLAKTIKKNSYYFEPAIEREAYIGGKKRLLYRQTITDSIVSKAAAAVLYPAVENYLSDRLFSYRKGRSSVQVLTQLQKFISQHKKNTPDKKKRGLYILKRDITAYGESIPTEPDSQLWVHLEKTLKDAGGGLSKNHPLMSIIEQSLKRRIIKLDGTETVMRCGTPTGSPLQPLVNNLYLTALDKTLENITGGFYARFGDDFVFAHPDCSTAMAASKSIDKITTGLCLTIKPEKKRNYYLTAPGRKSDLWPEAINAAHFEYLGCTVNFSGTIALKKDKASFLLNDIKKRLLNMHNVLKDEPLAVQIKSAALAASTAIDPFNPLCNRYAQLLLLVINDQRQLKHLDYLIALMIAKTVTGHNSVKAFRQVSYKELRKQGLKSLVVSKNSLSKKTKLNSRGVSL